MSLCFPPRALYRIAGVLAWIAGAGSFASAQVPDTLRYSLFAPKSLPQRFEKQGSAVAVSGNVAVVGSPNFDRDPVTGLDCGVVKVYDTDNGNLLQQLASPTGAAFGYFGQSVAISGTKIVVGSCAPVAGHKHAGRVYVYDLASATPAVPILSLENPEPSDLDQFGHSVAIEGDLIVVGSWLSDSAETNSGRAYVYDLGSPSPDDPVVTLENPTPAENDNFGVSVAVSGSRVAVAAYHDNAGNPKAGRVYVYDLDEPVPGVPVATLSKPGADPNDCFGNALAMSGPLVVVGAELSDTQELNSGNAYVFDLDSATPGQPVRALPNPLPQAHGYFGTSVSISGNIVAVGAYRNDTAASNGGAAYVFDLAGGTPTVPTVTLSRPGWDADDLFGNSVSVSGTKVVAGAWYDDTGDLDSGISYVYDLEADPPATPVTTLDSPLRESTDHFGSAVAIAGDLVVVGSPDSDAGATRAGRVSVHDLASAKPSSTRAFLENPNPAFNDAFGAAVGVSGTWVVVGAPRDDAGASNAGSVYVYDFSGDPPSLPSLTIPNPAPAIGDGFGAAISISGNLLVVGASLDDAGATDSGSVYVFDLASATPMVPIATIPNPGVAAGDLFGSSVAISGNKVVVGAMADDSSASNSGIAYLFELGGASSEVPVQTFANPGPLAEDGFGGAVGISGNTIAIGASGDDTGALDAGSVYVFDLLGANPATPSVTIPNPFPSSGDRFGNAVAVAEPRVVVGAFSDNSPTDSGRVYTFNMTSPTPAVHTAVLPTSGPAGGDQFGTSVGISGIIVVVGSPYDNKTAVDKGAAYVFGPAAPEIAVQGPGDEELMVGGSADFGAVAMGQGGGGTLTFTILNTGITGLPITGISVVNGDASDFSIGSSGTTLSMVPADNDASFTVTLNPTAAGPRSTTLRIQNGDSNENPFDILLTGTALSGANDSDGDGLNDVAELRMASLGFDWQSPDAERVAAFQTTAAPAGFFTPDQVGALAVVGPKISRDGATGNLKLKMSLKKSLDFNNYVPFPMTVPQTSINPQGEFEFRFSVPGNAALFRLETD